MKATSLVWFRNDLRVLDNSALTQAVHSGNSVVAVYVFEASRFEKGPFGFKRTQRFRAQFLIASIQQLQKDLAALEIDLLVFHGQAATIIPEIARQYNVSNVHLQKEWTSEEQQLQHSIMQELSDVHFVEVYDQFLFHPEDLPYENVSQLPKVFTPFRKKCEKEVSVRPILAVPNAMPSNNRIKNTTAIPTMSDLGFESHPSDHRAAFPFQGGEVAALERLEAYFWKTKKLQYYKKTRNGLVGADYSSKFSPWMSTGSLSARYIYWEVKRFEKEIKKNQDTYWLIFELIWRDFFKYVSMKHGDAIFQLGGILNRAYQWQFDPEILEQWIHGKTSYEFVNANMIELRETGWMSNRGRQNVASFWAKEMEQDWRVGAAYFESMLIDYDVHSNWGNWMYNAGVGNDPRDRKFNILRQTSMYDADGRFRRLWLQNTLF